jgi:hypothetical protein
MRPRPMSPLHDLNSTAVLPDLPGRTRVNDDDFGPRLIELLGEPAARELLDVLERPEADRAALIGRLYASERRLMLTCLRGGVSCVVLSRVLGDPQKGLASVQWKRTAPTGRSISTPLPTVVASTLTLCLPAICVFHSFPPGDTDAKKDGPRGGGRLPLGTDAISSAVPSSSLYGEPVGRHGMIAHGPRRTTRTLTRSRASSAWRRIRFRGCSDWPDAWPATTRRTSCRSA